MKDPLSTENQVARCWLLHSWSPWRDAGTHTTAFLGKKELEQVIPVQERRCVRCNIQQLREVRV